MVEFLAARTEPLVLNYHNVTPPQFYEPYDRSAAKILALAQAQIRRLAERSRLGLADSHFNAADQTTQPPIFGTAGGLSGLPPNTVYTDILHQILASVRRSY